MKRIKYILITLLLFLPLSVGAKEKINVYLFEGDGCGHCAAAAEFFESIDDEYKDYFNLVQYEVWHSGENSNLMREVATCFDEQADGVPYIVIGDQTFLGYAPVRDDILKEAIVDAYSSDEQFDVMEHLGEVVSNPTIEETNEDDKINQYNKPTENNKDIKTEEEFNSSYIIILECIVIIIVLVLIWLRIKNKDEKANND